ncbi:MAG: hypothetical protein GXO73_12040, partial [Calditrichaeota bacterium]|nr:hypothetical protein [Calditrichota bacterium]
MTARHFTWPILALAFLAAAKVQAQYGWPVTPFDSSQLITGTFCEYRPTLSSPHFHNGVDIPKADGSPVYAVTDGTVTGLERSGGNAYVRVGNFAYVHIKPAPNLTIGSKVTAHQTVIGTILSGAGHVHFIEGTYNHERNALRSGGGLTPYVDPWAPLVRYIRFYPDGSSQAFPGNQVSGKIDLVAKVDEQNGPPSSSLACRNNGTYELGYAVLDSDSVTVLIRSGTRFRFLTKPSNRYVHNVFLKKLSSITSHVYIATNHVDRNGWIDTAELGPGRYFALVWARDTRGNADTLVVPFEVVPEDKTPPAPPELLFVRGDSSGFRIRWKRSPEPDVAGYRLWYSFDNRDWELKFTEHQLPADCTSVTFRGTLRRPLYFRLTAVDNAPLPNESAPSDVYGMQQGAAPILIVDGFRRTAEQGGAWSQPSHPFAFYYAEALPEERRSTLGFTTCSADAVLDSTLHLDDFGEILWFTGDTGVDRQALSDSALSLLSNWLETKPYPRLLLIGANLVSSLDSTTNPYASATATTFVRRVLSVVPCGRRPGSGSVVLASAPETRVRYGQGLFNPDSVDALCPRNGATALLRFEDDSTAALTFYQSQNSHVAVLSVPLLAIDNPDSQRFVLELALSNLNTSVSGQPFLAVP